MSPLRAVTNLCEQMQALELRLTQVLRSRMWKTQLHTHAHTHKLHSLRTKAILFLTTSQSRNSEAAFQV